jgi:hypothetical protein
VPEGLQNASRLFHELLPNKPQIVGSPLSFPSHFGPTRISKQGCRHSTLSQPFLWRLSSSEPGVGSPMVFVQVAAREEERGSI